MPTTRTRPTPCFGYGTRVGRTKRGKVVRGAGVVLFDRTVKPSESKRASHTPWDSPHSAVLTASLSRSPTPTHTALRSVCGILVAPDAIADAAAVVCAAVAHTHLSQRFGPLPDEAAFYPLPLISVDAVLNSLGRRFVYLIGCHTQTQLLMGYLFLGRRLHILDSCYYAPWQRLKLGINIGN